MKILIILINYLLGSIPFGLIIAFLVKRIDIRKFGSGNIGATNVFRIVGKKWGVIVFILDFFKGFFAPLIAKLCLPNLPDYFFVIAVIAVVCGHNWPIFLKFKGGKGVATSVGGIAGLSLVFTQLSWALLFTLSTWLIVFLLFRIVSLASLLAATVFMVSAIILHIPWELKILSILLFIFIVIRHKKNIINLFAKKEFKF